MGKVLLVEDNTNAVKKIVRYIDNISDDLIKRCNKKLLDYEAKLHLVEKFMSIKSDIRRIHELTNDFKKSHNELLMNEIEAISNQILEEL